MQLYFYHYGFMCVGVILSRRVGGMLEFVNKICSSTIISEYRGNLLVGRTTRREQQHGLHADTKGLHSATRSISAASSIEHTTRGDQ